MEEKGKLCALDPLLYDDCEDQLHKQSAFVEHFYQLVTQSVQPPFAISIDGLWGSGKTTVMRLLQDKLRGRDGGYPVFWFNPWEYQEAESIVLAFLQRFADEKLQIVNKTVKRSLKLLGTATLLGLDVALSAVPHAIAGFLEKIRDPKKIRELGELFEKDYEKYHDVIEIIKEDFTKLTNAVSKKYKGKPIIIFFDDLDRCLPDKTIQLLEAVKNLFVVKDTKVIFICGIDTHIAKQFIKAHYKDIEETFAINYFRKIFNLTISMPYNPDNYKTLLEDYIKKLYSDNEKEYEAASELAKMIRELGEKIKMSSVRKYLNVINNFYTFKKFSSVKYQFKKEEFLIPALLVLREAQQPLYEIIVKDSLKNDSTFLKTLIEENETLVTEEKKLLSHYFFESPYASNEELKLSQTLKEHPFLT